MTKRPKATRLTVYNHKGGVGKTTLTVNIAAGLAAAGKRVLIVDSDPQCNVTSHFFNDEYVDKLLDASDSDGGKTVWSAVRNVAQGVGTVRSVAPHPTVVDNLFVLAGDIRLSVFENMLGEQWSNCFARRTQGLLTTNALSTLVTLVAAENNLDFVLYDTGPNIGPLNRAILLDCDGFIVPAACDLFSIRALNTLGQTIASWISDWRVIAELAPDGFTMMPGRPAFAGHIPQGFKVYGQKMAQTHATYRAKMEKQIASDIIGVLRKLDPDLASPSVSASRLGEVQNMSTTVQLAQQQGVPLWSVSGGNADHKHEAQTVFDSIAKKVISRMK